MKVIEHFKNTNKTYFSFELLPPLKGRNIDLLYRSIDNLMDFDPLNINITYHQEEVVYRQHPSGLLEKKSVRKRPGTVAIAAAIKYKYPKVHVVPHLICGGFSKDATEYALIDLHFLGVKDLLVLRGDPLKSQRYFKPEPDGHAYAVDLVKQITDMNRGKYLDEETQNRTATDFSIGVAGYPEKHIEAANMEADLQFLKEKVDAGADYIVTQMFFDNRKYIEFVKLCRKAGIEIPIIPGIKPINTKKDIKMIPKTFNCDIPEDLNKEISKCKDDAAAFQAGIEWGIQQSKELMEFGVPAIHYFTIGISDNVKRIAEKVF
ncbi:MAG: methylenetetrahydrofolate reductase [Bacteroidota bacterium]|nr:methylenetetrahydrofolate reductase [Bacteroidota bacterium]